VFRGIADEQLVVPPPVHLYALDRRDGKILRMYLDAIRCVARGVGASWERQVKFRRMRGGGTVRLLSLVLLVSTIRMVMVMV